jgi:hypothetical protein
MRKATAVTITKLVREHIFLEFQVPQYLICDNGVQFKSREFRSMCERYHTQIIFNAHYHPQTNPTERTNRTVKTMISSYIRDNHRQWDTVLADVACAIRTQKHEVTSHTPHFIVFGNEYKCSGREYNNDPEVTPDYARRSVGFAKLYEEVSRRILEAREKSSKQYNLRRRSVDYVVGQKVWRRSYSLSNALAYYSAKLAPKFIGPYKVRKKTSSWTYVLEDDSGKECGTWHVKDLKPWFGETEDF